MQQTSFADLNTTKGSRPVRVPFFAQLTLRDETVARLAGIIITYNRRLERLNKRYDLALLPISVTRGLPRKISSPQLGYEEGAVLSDLKVSGDSPRIKNWEICAKIERVEPGRQWLVSRVMGASLADVTACKPDNVCDHCQTKRRGRLSYLLKETLDDGTAAVAQIEGTCMDDFAWKIEPETKTVATLAHVSLLCQLHAELESLEARDRLPPPLPPIHPPSRMDLFVFLSYVRASIRVFGWVPRSQADGTMAVLPTVSRVRAAMNESAYPDLEFSAGIQPTDADAAQAEADLAFIKSELSASETGRTDFEKAIFDIVRAGYVLPRTAATAASICSYLDRRRKKP
jgi:hypothetical protein